jgi:hypothetical protein
VLPLVLDHGDAPGPSLGHALGNALLEELVEDLVVPVGVQNLSELRH